MRTSPLPRLAIVSTGIRRDLVAPLKYFTQFEIVHFYRRTEYGDLTADDLEASLRGYTSPLDLYRQIVRARPDILQGVEPFLIALQPYLWAGYFAARRVGARLLAVTLENRPLGIKFGRVFAFALRSVLRVYFARACLIIVLNDGARRNVMTCGVPAARVEKLMWGTWGVDVEEFAPGTRETTAPPTILFAGRLRTEKGVLVLLDAFARVRAAIPEARLVIVGDGPARPEIETRVAALSLSDAVTLTGTIKHRAMPDVFRAADVVAMPSLTTRKWEEQVGMVALQAMACGIPVVATRSGAIPEYVPESAGMLVPERDTHALADALKTILCDEALRERLGRAAREHACAHYDARLNVRRAEQVIKERCLARRV